MSEDNNCNMCEVQTFEEWVGEYLSKVYPIHTTVVDMKQIKGVKSMAHAAWCASRENLLNQVPDMKIPFASSGKVEMVSLREIVERMITK